MNHEVEEFIRWSYFLLLASGFTTEVGVEVVKNNKYSCGVRDDSANESWKSNPESKDSLSLDTLNKTVFHSIVWKSSICISLHLLQLGLDVVGWQSDGGTNDS